MKTLMIIGLAATVSLLAAGCGGGGNRSGIASVGSTAASTTTSSEASSLVAFSQCMRANGDPGFPDPQHYAGGNAKLTIHIQGGDPRVQTALRACNHLLPSGPGGSQETLAQLRTRIADELSFATCMRSHGVAGFPDPTAQGELSVAMVEAQGIDVHSPQVLHVVQTCLPASHGALTAAKVREAIANAGH